MKRVGRDLAVLRRRLVPRAARGRAEPRVNGGDLAGVVEDTAPEGVDECVHLRVEEVAPATGRQRLI